MPTVKNIPKNLRPREKLLRIGAEALSLVELVAVIINTGNKDLDVLKLASKIADKMQKKRGADYAPSNRKISKSDLQSIGLGPHKTALILAAQELGVRLSMNEQISIRDPESVYNHCHDIIIAEKESLVCFYFNARGEFIKREILAVGSINTVSILPREIFLPVKELPVSSIILAHNHPSGILKPSVDDIAFTKRVKKAGDILGVNLLDHLIVCRSGFVQIDF
jgi:DNA repair protein RadC